MTKPYGYCRNCGSNVIRCIHDDCPKHCDLCKSNESLDELYGNEAEFEQEVNSGHW